jgi:hypothetical protein
VDNSQREFIAWLTARGVLQPAQIALVEQVCADGVQSPEQAVKRLGLLSEEDLIALYADLHQLRFLKIEDVEIDPEATRHIPARIARRYSMIPIRRSGNTLALVMADPLNEEALAAARLVTDFELIPFAGREDAIEHAVYLHYGEQATGETSRAAAPPQMSATMRSRLLGGDDRVGHMAKSIPLNPEWSWDRFTICSANEHVAELLRSLPDAEPESTAGVIFVSGERGSGKTHLLHATAHAAHAKHPMGRQLLTTARRFAAHYAESARDGKLNLFRYLYRELDLLLIDGVEWMLSRDWAQTELAATIEALLMKGRCVCLASRIDSLNAAETIPELRAILARGDRATIGTYVESARLDILRSQCGGVSIPEPVLEHLARRSQKDIGRLLDSLRPLIVFAAQTEGALTPEKVVELLRPLNRESLEAEPVPDGIAVGQWRGPEE